MKFGSILRGALSVGVTLYKAIKGTDEQPDGKDLAGILTGTMASFLPAVSVAQEVEGLKTPDKIISWLKAIDDTTGVESTAIGFIPGFDPREEEIISDSCCDIAGTIMFNKIGLNYSDYIEQIRDRK